MARILAIGGAHIDRKGWLDGPHRPGVSNPGRWEVEAGGGAFNAARNLARLGHQVTLVAPRGGDAAAGMVAEAAAQAGIEDCPLTFLDRATPSYSAILEPDGNLVTALADMALYDLNTGAPADDGAACARALPALSCCWSIPTCPKARLRRWRTLPPALACRWWVIAVSPAKVVRWRASLSRIACLAMNTAEAAALTGAQGRKLRRNGRRCLPASD